MYVSLYKNLVIYQKLIMSSKYKPMASKKVDPDRNNAPTVLEKYGHITVVTASINLLFLFLKRQLYFLSTRDVERFGEMVGWATTNLEDLEKIKGDIRDTLDEIAFDYRTSFSARFLGCKVQKNNDGREFSYCRWYHERNSASDKIKEENPLTLGEARANDLLDQLCFRLNNLIYRINRDGNCDYDFYAEKLFRGTRSEIDDMLEDFLVQQKTLEEFQEKNRKEKQSNKTNGKNSKPKTDVKKTNIRPVPVLQEPVEPSEPTPEVCLESLTSNF